MFWIWIYLFIRNKRSWFIIEKIELDKITTELRNKNSLNIDKMNSSEIIKIINSEDKTIAYSIEKELDSIAMVIDQAYSAIENGGRIIYIGAGTSGRLGVLDASEMPPTFGVDKNLFIGVIAGGEFALRNAIENVEDSIESAILDLVNINFSKKDFLIGIAASGRTPYVLSAINFAKDNGAKTASISTVKNSAIGNQADFPIEIEVGAEIITGSTRMKSGTAQKMTLNMISTGVMIKLGKVYENLMIDVKATNEKLKERAIKIVSEIAKCNYETAKEKLTEANNQTKIAIVMIIKNISYDNAKKLIENYKGKLREVIDER